MKNIWKYLLGLAVVVLLVGYAWFSQQGSESATANINLAPDGGGSSSTTPSGTTSGTSGSGAGTGAGSGSHSGTTGGGTHSTSTGTGTSGGGSTGLYKDGTYTGTVADAFYGQLQASVVIQGGKIVDVTFPQYPNAPGHTTEVSGFALPQLKQEAIAAQSSNVNIVSGATQDSMAFQQSLAAALSQAKS